MLKLLMLSLLLPFLAACVSIPSGPSMLVLPGSGKNFDQFRSDDAVCRQYANEQVGGVTPNQASAASGVGSAVVGTALGAAAGAVIGGGQGAAVGAGTGFFAGGLVGTGTATSSGYVAQQRYDIGYIQCMYARGNRVPVSGQITGGYSPEGSASPVNIPPPPPPGAPPPTPSAR